MVYALEVVCLAAHTANHKDRGLAVAEAACSVRLIDAFPGSLVDVSIIKIASVFLLQVPVEQVAVHDRKAALFHDVLIGRSVRGGYRAGAGTAVYRGDCRCTKEGYVCSLQRQCVIIVFQQNGALAFHLTYLCKSGSL